MAGRSPTPRRTKRSAGWPRTLHHAALLLAAGGALFWLAFASSGIVVPIPGIGLVYLDLLLAWIAVTVDIAAWPSLWAGLRDLRRTNPEEGDPVVAWRAFLLSAVVTLGGLAVLPLMYPPGSSPLTWFLVLYTNALAYLVWTFVPILALHGILFARVSRSLDLRSEHLARVGVTLLFAVALTTVLVVIGNPEGPILVQTWSVGKGLLPAVAGFGYLLIGWSLTLHGLPEPKPARGWDAAVTPKHGVPWTR